MSESLQFESLPADGEGEEGVLVEGDDATFITAPDSDVHAADGSEASSGTGSGATQQTRFSFYNAEDFAPKSPERQEKSSTLINSKKKKKEETATSRFNFYNADEVNNSSDEQQNQLEQQHQQSDLTPVHILRSLQEHEQQRSDILGETKQASSTTSAKSNQSNNSPVGDSSQSSNPYEDAIKDALDLLRKHRYASGVSSPSSAASDAQQQQQQRVRSPTSGAATTTTTSPIAVDIATETSTSASLVQSPNNTYENANNGDDDEYDDQEANELKQQLENLVRSGDPDDPILQARAWDAEGARALSSPTGTETSLGEVYQAEIEARRKQRQERMAKYANRLAELKQEGDADTASAAGADPIHNNNSSSNTSRSQSHNDNPWVTTPQIRSSWEDVPSSRHGGGGGNTPTGNGKTTALDTSGSPRDGAISQSGSVSTLSRHEEEVQRGVERVLLAILERANSQGRAAQSNSWQEGEEKKSALLEEHAANTLVARTKEQDDALVKAMSDLLGSASSDIESATSALDNLRRQNQQQHPGQRIVTDDSLRIDLSMATQFKDLTLNDSICNESLDEFFKDIESTASGAERRDIPEPAAPNNGKYRSFKSDPPPNAVVDERVFDDALVALESSEMIEEDVTCELDALVRSASKGSEPDDIDEILHNVREKRGIPQAVPRVVRDNQRVANGLDNTFDQRARTIRDDSKKKKDAPANRRFSNTEEDDDEDEDDSYSSHSHSSSSESRESDTEGDSRTFGESRASDDDSYDDDDDDDDMDTEEDEDKVPEPLDGVLGPLSKRSGGTTGVVLEADSLLARKEVTSPSIYDSLSAAMSMVHSAVSYDDHAPVKDKYLTEHEADPEAEELMRTLCAHLLPFGVDLKSELLDQIPAWDETNPDEAGYRIIRLTRDQLRRIEKAFENMATGLKKDSERNLAEANGSDEAFERDLLEAEELLEREEKKLKATERTHTSVKKDNGASVHGLDVDNHGKLDEDDCLEAFPGIRPTGKGEMGDLEYFNLPIIFKSHVTGFESSKDLCLEAGNIVAGQYLVESELGTAAFSTAYKCVDLNSEGDDVDGHEEVCLKVIKNTKDFFDQSLDEIKILELLRQSGRCDEKSIVEMRTFFYYREHLVIVTELLRQNLFEFGKFIIDNDEEPYFTMTRLSYITKQCLTALDFVHNLGLVHSDVKPENILLSSYSRAQIKLIDFGSSCYLTDRQSSYIQSRSYRAPEVVLGLPYDGRIDIWSLGCVVAEMFTGEVTFQNDSIVSMLSRIEALCGPFPRHMIAQGRQSSNFFTKCGLLYEKVSSGKDGERKDESSNDGESDGSEADDDKGKPRYCDIFQPKSTTLSARLGYSPDLLKNYDSGKRLSKELKRRAMFVDFIRKLLTIDPETRPTAAEALKHPWIQYATSLSEDDVKYPSG